MVEHVILPALLLFVLYCVGRLVRPIGDFYAAVLQAVAKVCQAVRERISSFGGSSEGSQDSRLGLRVIPQLAGLAVGLLVLLGEFTSSYLAVRTLFGNVPLPRLPIDGLAGPALAVLIFALCVTYGICWVDAAELVPPEIRILMVPEAKRKGFKWFGAAGLAISLLAMILFYAQRTLFLANVSGDSTLSEVTFWLQLGTFLLLAVLAVGAAVLAFSMVITGLQALTRLVLAIVVFVAGLLDAICEVLGRHFSRPNESAEDGAISVQSAEQGETAMNNGEGNVDIYLLGEVGWRIQPVIEKAVRDVRAKRRIALTGSLNFSREAVPLTIGRNVTPPSWQQDSLRIGAKTMNLTGAKTKKQERDHARKKVCTRLGELLSDEHLRLPSLGRSLWFFIDPELLPVAIDMLKLVHRRLDDCAIVVMTQLDEFDRQSPEIRKALQELGKTGEERFVTVTFVFSTPSAFTNHLEHVNGEGKQLEAICRTVTGLLLAEEHSPLNLSCTEILERLGRISPYVEVSFSSDRLAPVRIDGLSRAMQWMRGGVRTPVVGDYGDILGQMELVTRQAMRDPSCRTSMYKIQEDKPAVVICSTPLKPKDPRFEPLRESLTTLVAHEDGRAVSVLTYGNGLPLDVPIASLDHYYLHTICIRSLVPGQFEDRSLESEPDTAALGLPEEHVIASVEAEHFPSPNNHRVAARKAR